MSLHASALQQTAAQRQLWERLLASLPTARAPPAAAAAAAGAPAVEEMGPLQARLAKQRLTTVPTGPGGLPLVPGTVKEGVEGEDGVSSSSSDSSDGEEDGEVNDPLGRSMLGSLTRKLGAAGAMALDIQQAAGTVGGAGDGGPSPWESAMRLVVGSYVSACKKINSSAKAEGIAAGALLHVSASQGRGVLMAVKPGPWGRREAIAHIRRIDPPSESVDFERIVPLSLDATLTGVSVSMAGAPQPILTATTLSASGWVIRARQLAAPPTMRHPVFMVGRYHAAPAACAVKGCRPPMKAYTDLKVEVEEVAVCGGVGLEPAFGQVGAGGQAAHDERGVCQGQRRIEGGMCGECVQGGGVCIGNVDADIYIYIFCHAVLV